jgi:DnaK suppressor protein
VALRRKRRKAVSELIVGEFRRLLEVKYAELSATSFNREGIVIEAAADEMDRVQAQMGRDIAIHSLDRTSTLLKSIRAALGRIDDDMYGMCLRCEEPIAEKRLKAIPWASYCVDCQESIDSYASNRDDDAIAFAA